MDGMQEQTCAGCEFYEDNYKKALERFLLYKEKIMCTQTLIQKYERRKQHNQQLLRKLQKSRQNVGAVRERFMHYMERYMPLEKSYNELTATHNDLEEKMRTQSSTLDALQQHNKQLSALVEVQEKGVNDYKEKCEYLQEELKRKLRINQIAKSKADDRYRNTVKSAIELAVLLKDKGMLPDSYKLCLRSWKKQLSQDIKPENLCDSGGQSPDKASSISSQDTGFDSSKSTSDEENLFDENAMGKKGAAGDKRCNTTLKSATPSISLETSISDKSVNTRDIVRKSSTSRATQSYQNLRDVGVNTSVSMLTPGLSKFLHEMTISDCKNSGQSPSDQGMEDHDFEPLPFDPDSQIIDPHHSPRGSIFSPIKGAVHSANAKKPPNVEMSPSNDCVEEYHRGSIFSPVKGAVHSASAEKPRTSAEKPATSVHMSPSNDCVEEYQSKFVQSEKLVFTNADPSKTIPPHLKNTCTAGESLSVSFASEVPVFGKGQSFHERNEEERRGGVGRGRREEEELGEEEEELGLGVGGEGKEEECYDDGCNDGANNISSPAHDKGRNLHTGREDVHNEWNRRMQTTLCFKDPFRGSPTTESRVSHILQEMKLFAPRLVSPMSSCSDEIPTNNAAVTASSEMCSTDLRTSVMSSVKCDRFQADFGVSQTCSNNNSVFQQQPVQAGRMKKQNLPLMGKRSSSQKKIISNTTHDQDTEARNLDCKIGIKPLKRVCQKEHSSKYSSVLARFSTGKDDSSLHHSPIKAKMTSPKNILSDPKYTNVSADELVKSVADYFRVKTLKYTKRHHRSRKLRRSILKTLHSPKKRFAANTASSTNTNVVKSASGCFLETVNDTAISFCSVESTPKSGKFEETVTFTETVNYRHDKPNVPIKVFDRTSKLSPLHCSTDVLASEKQQKEGRSHLRLMAYQETEKSRRRAEKNILRHATHALTRVTQKQVGHKEPLSSNIVAHDIEPEVNNQTLKSFEKDEKDTENVVMELNSTSNCEGTVNNSECSEAITNTRLFSTNDSSNELKRKDSDTVSCLGYTELLDDLSVSDDNSGPESINASSDVSHCVEAEGSDDECRSDSEVASNKFFKTAVPRNNVSNGTKCEVLNHDDIGSEKSCDQQCNSESIEEVFDHSNARYFIPQMLNDNESVVNYEEVETTIPVECTKEICVGDKSVDLLDPKADRQSQVQKINLISEAGESISEISTYLSASSNTDKRTTNNVEVSFSHLNSGSDGSNSEIATVNEKELELNSVSSSKSSTDSLAQPDIATDSTAEPSVPASTDNCTMDCSDVLHDNNTEIVIEGSEVNVDKDVVHQISKSPNDCASKKIDSVDTTRAKYNGGSELSKDSTEIHECTNEIINQCESHIAMKGHKHTKDKQCSDNNSINTCKDVNGTELMMVKSGLQKGTMKDSMSDPHKICNIDVNGKSEKELEAITHTNSVLKEDLFTRKCGRRPVVSSCDVRKSLINGSVPEEPIIKEQQEPNKYDIPVEKIPQAELDISKQEGKDTAEAYDDEYYYMPLRTKKRIAHKPKTRDSGSESCSEDKNFKSPIKAPRKQTPRKTKQKTEDEQRDIKSVNQEAPNSSSKLLGHTVDEIGGGLQSLPLNVITDNMKKKCTLETKCSSSEVIENVNLKKEANKLKTEIEKDTDALLNSAKKMQSKMVNSSVSEEPIIKEQQESNKYDISVEKIPQAELDISKQEGKDTTEAYGEEYYYMPLRTKKRIAHKPKTRDSGSESCSEDKNFKSPIKAPRKQTPRKTKQKTEDEQRDIKSVNQEAQNSSSKLLGHTVNEIGGGLQSLPLNIISDNMEEKFTLETKCSSSEVTENVNLKNRAKKLKTETELGTDALLNSAQKMQSKMARLDKQLEQPSTHLQAARRSARLKKIDTVTLRQIAATKRRKKITEEKSSTADSIQEIVSIKTEPFDDCPSSLNMDHVKKEKCDINEASYAGEPLQPVQNSKIEILHNLQDDTDAGAVRPLIGGYKRKIQSETGGENSRKKVAPGLFKKQPHCQIKCENEANYPVSSSTLEGAPEVNCKSEIQSSCMVLFPSDKNKCKEECADGNIPTSTSQENNKCGSVTNSGSRTSLEETGSNNATGHLNGEYVYERNNKESDITLDGIGVCYAKGDIIRKCLAIQQRNKLVARRPTRKIFIKQQVFVSQQLSELLGGDFTNEVLNVAIEELGQEDSPVDAFALVRCVLKTLLQEDCNEIDRSHDVRAPPLSVVEEKLITFMITLRNRCSKFSTLIDDFLTAVEYHIFNFRTTPEYDVLHILTRFYAALCKAEGLRERAQAFCYDALYCLKRKCFPIIYTILIYYPEAFPRASIGMTSPVCVCIVHSIFTSLNDANNTYLRIKPLIALLRRIYEYKLEEVLSCDLVDCFLKHLICQTSKSGEVCAAVTLLAKRKDRTWTLTQLIPKYIAPIIQEWRQGKINEAVMSGVIDIIGCVVKPFTEQCDLGPVLKIFKGILHTDKLTQSLKMKAALNLARQASSHFSEAAPILYEWVPGGELPNEFWEQMSDILSVKPHSFWRTFLKTCEETNEEMCVDSLNN